MRAAIVLFAAAVILAGCGSDESTTTPTQTTPAPGAGARAGASSAPVGTEARSCGTVRGLTKVRAVAVACDEARKVAAAWDVPRCRPSSGESRSACSVRRYRCQGVVTDRGVSVSCSRPGQSISFLRPR